jgi:hypothetical protein
MIRFSNEHIPGRKAVEYTERVTTGLSMPQALARKTVKQRRHTAQNVLVATRRTGPSECIWIFQITIALLFDWLNQRPLNSFQGFKRMPAMCDCHLESFTFWTTSSVRAATSVSLKFVTCNLRALTMAVRPPHSTTSL